MSIAFIVEGKTEVRLIQTLCPGKRVVKIHNGATLTPFHIASNIQAQFGIMNNKHYPVVVILDKEERVGTAVGHRDAILLEMEKLKLPLNQFLVFIADKHFESWIAPFIDEKGQIITTKPQDNPFEGGFGEIYLKKVIKNYNVVVHALELFPQLNYAHLAEISSSFKALKQGLSSHCEVLKP